MSHSKPLRLFIDGSEKGFSVSAQSGDKSIALFNDKSRDTLECLFPFIEKALTSVGGKYRAVEEMYVTTGPGSNTGLRMVLTQARVFFALKPTAVIYAASTFDVLFNGAQLKSGVVLISDRHNSFFYAVYKDGQAENKGHIADLQELTEIDGTALVVADKDENAVKAVASKAKHVVVNLAQALIAIDVYTRFTPDHIQDLLPLYTNKI